MVQFLSIIFFSWISSIFVGFFKSSRFLCHSVPFIILYVSADRTFPTSYKLSGPALQNARRLSKLLKCSFVVHFLKDQMNQDQKSHCFLGKQFHGLREEMLKQQKNYRHATISRIQPLQNGRYNTVTACNGNLYFFTVHVNDIHI